MLVAGVAVETGIPAEGTCLADYSPEMWAATVLYLQQKAAAIEAEAAKQKRRR